MQAEGFDEDRVSSGSGWVIQEEQRHQHRFNNALKTLRNAFLMRHSLVVDRLFPNLNDRPSPPHETLRLPALSAAMMGLKREL
jgi:hypothetical protein